MNYLYNIQRMEENVPRFYRIGVVKSKPKIANLPDYEIKDKVLDWLDSDMEVRVSDKIELTSNETLIVQPYNKDEQGFRTIEKKIFKDDVEIPDVIVQTQYNSKQEKH